MNRATEDKVLDAQTVNRDLDLIWLEVKTLLLREAQALTFQWLKKNNLVVEPDEAYARLKLDLIARMSMECAIWTRDTYFKDLKTEFDHLPCV
jgi:hypothetical protein